MAMIHLKNNPFYNSSMIELAVKSMDYDLEIVSFEGTILTSNFYLISMASPLLKSLLPTDKSAPPRIHLPDVSSLVISHLLNIVKQGFTTGQGPANSIRREIQEAFNILGFTKVPVLTYDDGREDEMSNSSETFDEGDGNINEETQKEHNDDIENSLHDVNYPGKSSGNDVEMHEARKKLEVIELKVASWLKGQENIAKVGNEEGMRLLEALDGMRKHEEQRKSRKYLNDRIQKALDMNELIQELQKLTANGVIISTENSMEDVNENMANSSNNGIDVIKQTTSQHDESMGVTETIEEKKKPESDDTSWKPKKLNIGDDPMIYSEDSKDEDEDDSQDYMEQDLAIGQEKSYQTQTNPTLEIKAQLYQAKKCNVLFDKKWITPGKENILNLSKRNDERLHKVQTEKANLKRSEKHKKLIKNIEPPMVSAAKRRRVIPEPEENEIEIIEKFHNNCEVREVISNVLKVDPTTGEDDTDGENFHIVPIPCGACNKVFSNASTLLVHCEKHTGGEGIRYCPYFLCTYIGSRTAMLQHLRAKHTREKLFKCSSCEERFASSQMLKYHVKKIH